MIKARATIIFAVLAAALKFFNGCGRLEDVRVGSKKADKAPLELTPMEQLFGTWSGLYRVVDANLPQQSGETMPAELELSLNGGFKLQLASQEANTVLGRWTEFQGKNLLLNVEGSTVPRVGSAGKISEVGYSLVGSSLHIFTSNFEAKLTRKIESNTPSTQAGSKSTWICYGPGSRVTNIVFSAPAKFKLTSHKKGERLIVASGNVEVNTDHSKALSPICVED